MTVHAWKTTHCACGRTFDPHDLGLTLTERIETYAAHIAEQDRDALSARLAAVEALLRNPDGVPHGNTYQVTAARLRAVLSAAPTDPTKET